MVVALSTFFTSTDGKAHLDRKVACLSLLQVNMINTAIIIYVSSAEYRSLHLCSVLNF